ncbi:MAG TPA: hypothetical protein P5023_08670 [Bacteroidales bacterium]|nr:hypothetical protein [Bacteroidales bacterium]
MEILNQWQFRQNTREILFSCILSAIEDKTLEKYDPDLHSFNPGVTTGIPHSKLFLDMINVFLEENKSPYGFTEWWSKQSDFFEMFRRVEDDIPDILKKLEIDDFAIIESRFFQDDIEELQMELDDIRDNIVDSLEGGWYSGPESIEKFDELEPVDWQSWDILDMFMVDDNLIKTLWEGFDVFAVQCNHKKGIAFKGFLGKDLLVVF